VVPVVERARALLGDAALIVIILDSEECPQPPIAVLKQLFQLSKSEAEVARRLMCGESLQEIAEASHVTVETVRTQLKSVFSKTGTNRQVELVALLTRIALIS
jgi:DNA-binding CsgD family transcriptional regulator